MRRRKPRKGISRIDQPDKRTHGFFVRLKRRGKVHSAFFADASHGGRAVALRAAQKHYQELLRRFGPVKKPAKFPEATEAVGKRQRSTPTPAGLSFSQLSWVQSGALRCLAYRDAKGRWVNFYTGSLLAGRVQVVD